jgi:hypothetical protein
MDPMFPVRSRAVVAALALPLVLAACSQADNPQPPNAAGAAQGQLEQAPMEGLPDAGMEASGDTTNSVNDPNGTELEWPSGVLAMITDVAIGPVVGGYDDNYEPDPAQADTMQAEVRVTLSYRNTTDAPIGFGEKPSDIRPFDAFAYGPNGEAAPMMLGGALWEEPWLDTWGSTPDRIAAGGEAVISYRYAVPADAVNQLEFALRERYDAPTEHRWTELEDIARTVML